MYPNTELSDCQNDIMLILCISIHTHIASSLDICVFREADIATEVKSSRLVQFQV